MDFFEKILDLTYRFVKREGDFSLQFFADFIRGTSTRQDEKIKKSKSEVPLIIWWEKNISGAASTKTRRRSGCLLETKKVYVEHGG